MVHLNCEFTRFFKQLKIFSICIYCPHNTATDTSYSTCFLLVSDSDTPYFVCVRTFFSEALFKVTFTHLYNISSYICLHFRLFFPYILFYFILNFLC